MADMSDVENINDEFNSELQCSIGQELDQDTDDRTLEDISVESNLNLDIVRKSLSRLVEAGKLTKRLYRSNDTYTPVDHSSSKTLTVNKSCKEPIYAENNEGNVSYDAGDDAIDFKKFVFDKLVSLQHEIEQLKDNTDSSQDKTDSSQEIIKGKDAIINLLREKNRFLRQEDLELVKVLQAGSLHQNEKHQREKHQKLKNQKTISNNISNSPSLNDKEQNKSQPRNTVGEPKSQDQKRKNIESRNNESKTTNNNINNKKHVIIIGDSMVKEINPRGISRYHKVDVRSHSAATTSDLIDHIKPYVRKKPDIIVIHIGTNDLTNKVNTRKKIKNVIAAIREIDRDQNIEIILSSIIGRKDQDLTAKLSP
ncbi:rho GTPase-activating protein gacU-like [Hydractinia symbiolongicarpus]|uniref:rho GTPase-activating protein gacU-like n=1 Tax=Hydractinia symbiolongicarpus TaxID=13093 RepID=UPI00254C3827|nr:rho GTPase-activating protein gacU-like [Hydractinia symbiolongicarpus]